MDLKATSKGRYEVETEQDPQDEWGDSQNDMRDMQRLGKKQEFKRNFRRS